VLALPTSKEPPFTKKPKYAGMVAIRKAKKKVFIKQ
jgi:hypothetical protein